MIFFLAGLFSIGFFSVAVTGRLLGRRVIASEEMARQRGEELKNQTLINQRVIEEMQDGVLVLDQRVVIKQCNPRAEQLLGFSHSLPEKLTDYSSELVYHFLNWCEHANDMAVFINAPISGLQLRARFVATNSTRNEVLVFLEDTARVQAQAQQIKLAALGRLTGNIAHEIRNPLSAINHAGELLQEGEQDKASLRLLRIVLDNVKRVERIVSDVLELGRRDRSNREALDLREILPAFVEEYVSKEHIDPYKLTCEISGLAILFFDRTHLHQVLSNLVSNAFRHSQERSCTVILRVHDTRDHKVNIHVIDDGSGIDATLREQLFEPFFTTHSRGTGLGLYIARELCQANGGQLELLNTPSCTDFCISGRSSQ